MAPLNEAQRAELQQAGMNATGAEMVATVISDVESQLVGNAVAYVGVTSAATVANAAGMAEISSLIASASPNIIPGPTALVMLNMDAMINADEIMQRRYWTVHEGMTVLPPVVVPESRALRQHSVSPGRGFTVTIEGQDFDPVQLKTYRSHGYFRDVYIARDGNGDVTAIYYVDEDGVLQHVGENIPRQAIAAEAGLERTTGAVIGRQSMEMISRRLVG
jgi:hypothetical protein